jgi:hypothetical protein
MWNMTQLQYQIVNQFELVLKKWMVQVHGSDVHLKGSVQENHAVRFGFWLTIRFRSKPWNKAKNKQF